MAWLAYQLIGQLFAMLFVHMKFEKLSKNTRFFPGTTFGEVLEILFTVKGFDNVQPRLSGILPTFN